MRARKQYPILSMVIVLLLAAISADAGHYRKNPPAKCRTINSADFTFPPVTIFQITPDENGNLDPEADVWLEMRVSEDGLAHDIKVLWCTIDDSSYEQTAMEVAATRVFDEHKIGDFRPKALRHIVQFRHQRKIKGQTDSDSTSEKIFGLGMITAPEMVFQQQPKYPKQAVREGHMGPVWITCLVSPEGNVVESIIGKSSGSPYLDYAALLASFQNKFKPARQDDRSVSIWVTYKVEFILY